MHRILQPERDDSVRAVAKISQTESRVILLISQRQPLTPSQIADQMGFDRAVVTRTITTLIEKKLIIASPSAEDQRSKSVRLTAKGATLCDQLTAVMDRFSHYLDQLLSDDEKANLLSTLDKLLQGALAYEQGGPST
jgi:DNA-binding MarR family transcriptional regulator